MKLKIISNGKAWETKVINEDTGEELKNVRSVSWKCSVGTPLAEATLEIIDVPIDVVGEMDVEEERKMDRRIERMSKKLGEIFVELLNVRKK